MMAKWVLNTDSKDWNIMELIEIIKFFAIGQLVLIALLIVIFFLTRLFFFYKEKKKVDLRQQINQTLSTALENKTLLDTKDLKLLEKHSFDTVTYFAERESAFQTNEFFSPLKNQLSSDVFKPIARRFAHSKRWFNRYTSALAYTYGIDEADEENLISLAKDKSLLVAMNAATTLVNNPNPRTINAVIDVFSQGRRIQQSVCSELLMKTKVDITPIVLERLEKESNIYTRIFCYRLLCKLPSPKTICQQAQKDILADSVDLKIAALNYIHHSTDESKDNFIFSLAVDPHWEVRATVARLLSTNQSTQCLTTLESLLSDSQWWVCLNAAHALERHGDQGISILKKQTPDESKYSFEVAQNVIKHIERQNHKPSH